MRKHRVLVMAMTLVGVGLLAVAVFGPATGLAVFTEIKSRATRFRSLLGSSEPADAVLEHRPGGGRVGGREERQHEHVAVPEDMAAVARPGESTQRHTVSRMSSSS